MTPISEDEIARLRLLLSDEKIQGQNYETPTTFAGVSVTAMLDEIEAGRELHKEAAQALRASTVDLYQEDVPLGDVYMPLVTRLEAATQGEGNE